jgi:hypothetical protein
VLISTEPSNQCRQFWKEINTAQEACGMLEILRLGDLKLIQTTFKNAVTTFKEN